MVGERKRPKTGNRLSRRAMLVGGASVAFGISTVGCTTANRSPIATAGPQGSSNAWRNGATVRSNTWLGQAIVRSAAWSADSRRVAARLSFGQGFVLNGETGERLTNLPPPAMTITATGTLFTPGDQSLVVSGQVLGQPADQAVALTLLDSESGRVLREIKGLVPPNAKKNRFENLPSCMGFDPTTSELLVQPVLQTPPFNALEVFNPQTWQAVSRPLQVRFIAYGLGFALQPHGRDIAFQRGGDVWIHDRTTGAVVTHFHAMPAALCAVDYKPDGSLLLAAMWDLHFGATGAPVKSVEDADRHKVAGWRTTDYRKVGEIDEYARFVQSVRFHPDGGIFAVGCSRRVLIFDSTTFALVNQIDVPTRQIQVLEFSPDGTALATGGTYHFCIVAPS